MNKIGENEIDFFNLFKEFLHDEEHIILNEDKKTLSISKKENDDSVREFCGEFKSGVYAISADFLNIEDEDDLNLEENARTINDSEVYPFFFLLSLPNNFEKGILILQTYSTHRIKTVVEKALNSFVQKYDSVETHENLEKYEEFKDYLIEIKPLVSKKMLERLRQSDAVYEIKLINYKIPANSAKRLHNANKKEMQLIGNPENIKETHTFTLKSKKKDLFYKENISDALKNVKNTFGEIFEDKYDEFRIVVEIDGAEHSLIFGTRNEFKEALPLPENKIVFANNGFPEYTYLKSTAKGYLSYLNE